MESRGGGVCLWSKPHHTILSPPPPLPLPSPLLPPPPLQKRLKAAEAESKLKQVYIPN